jgi:type III pantothenate kinase
MNIIAIDIGNSNIGMGLFIKGKEIAIQSLPGTAQDKVQALLISLWEQLPVVKSSKEGKRDGVIVVSSVKPAWTSMVKKITKQALQENIKVIGKDVPLPISLWVDKPEKVGTDRVVAAAAAYTVAEQAVVVADFGTAVTIDLVDQHGVFQGGVIFPGFELAAASLKEYTAQLPKIKVSRPSEPLGKNTRDAICCGLYYAAIGSLEEIIRRYADKIGTWPQTILTGAGADLIKDDCPFADAYVPNLVIKGIVMAYQKYLEEKTDLV